MDDIKGSILHTFPKDIFKIVLGFLELNILHHLFDIPINLYHLLSKCCSNGNLEVIKYLVSLGVDIRVFNDSAFQFASSNNHIDVVKYLVSLQSKIGQPSVCREFLDRKK